MDVLIHLGINTVSLEGEGFEAFVQQGDRVKKGDRLIRADLELIREKGLNAQTMMILPEGENLEVEIFAAENACRKDRAMVVCRK